MLVIDSPRAKRRVAVAWLVFAAVNTVLMFEEPGKETIPYHLIWASFALLYGIAEWSFTTTWVAFAGITVATGVPLIRHAQAGIIGWEECSEIVLMAVIAALLVWHVNRHQAARRRIAELRDIDHIRSGNRELATRFGSHELRTRLAIARGFADLIREGADDGSIRADADLVLSELDKATALASHLMMLVRVDAVLGLHEVDLDEVIDAVVRRWESQAQRRWSQISTAGVVLGDAERLEAVLDCLIENSVKFTELGDVISVVASLDGPDLVMSVQDSGAGIPADDLASVTDLFHTSRNSGARAGSGLGLAIVRAAVEARGGGLDIASVLDAGTTVTIRIPHGVQASPALVATSERPTPQIVRSRQPV